jgi:uncharacterized protein YjaG (DUF416 family)
MNDLKFEENSLVARLSILPVEYMVVFAACCAERLLPAYKCFATDNKLEGCLSNVWDWLSNTKITNSTWNDLLEKCLALMPSEDSQELESAAYAEDAVAATSYAIRTKISGQPNEATWAARRVYEAVDQYVIRERRSQGKEPFNEPEVLHHPICQQELQRQLRDLEDLEKDNNFPLSTVFINLLRSRAITESESIFSKQSA